MPQPLAPPWCLLLGGRLRHGIDGDYAKKRSLLPLDFESTQSWGFRSVDAESSIGCMKLEALVTDAPDLSSLVLTTEKGLFPAIHAVDKNLIVFFSHLPNEIGGTYIIYDTISKALSMIPSEPPRFEFDMTLTTRPLIARRHAKDESYALVLMGKKPLVAGEDKPVVEGEDLVTWQDVLAIWRPSSSSSSSSSPWDLTKTANLPGHWLASGSATSFLADVTFSFQGHAFWADLLCGVLFCRCSDLFSHSGTSVNLGFIDLPRCCQAEVDIRFTGTLAGPEAYRTMGCSGGSIKFVSIDFKPFHGNRRVTVWRLHFGSKTWVKQCTVTQKHLWKQPEFSDANLPRDMTLMHPILSTLEEDVICLMLGKYQLGSTGIIIPNEVFYSIRVNMFYATILSSAPIPSAYTFAPIILSSDFTSYIPSDTSHLGPPVASPSGNERGKGRGRGQVTLLPLAGRGQGWDRGRGQGRGRGWGWGLAK